MNCRRLLAQGIQPVGRPRGTLLSLPMLQARARLDPPARDDRAGGARSPLAGAATRLPSRRRRAPRCRAISRPTPRRRPPGRPAQLLRERGSAPERGGHSTIVFPPNASVQWQLDDLTIHTRKWFLGAGFLGAPPISPSYPTLWPLGTSTQRGGSQTERWTSRAAATPGFETLALRREVTPHPARIARFVSCGMGPLRMSRPHVKWFPGRPAPGHILTPSGSCQSRTPRAPSPLADCSRRASASPVRLYPVPAEVLRAPPTLWLACSAEDFLPPVASSSALRDRRACMRIFERHDHLSVLGRDRCGPPERGLLDHRNALNIAVVESNRRSHCSNMK